MERKKGIKINVLWHSESGPNQGVFKLIHMGLERDFIIFIQFELSQYSISWCTSTFWNIRFRSLFGQQCFWLKDMPIQYMNKSIQDRDRWPGERELFWYHSKGYTHNGMSQKYIDASFYKVDFWGGGSELFQLKEKFVQIWKFNHDLPVKSWWKIRWSFSILLNNWSRCGKKLF